MSDDDVIVDTLRDGQEIGLYVLTMISATISIVGSSLIAFKVFRNLSRAGPYDRFLLGLSMCDIEASLTFFFTPFMLPQDTSNRAWASGNEATCTALGFFTQLSYAAFVYNGSLSFYYLLTVRYGVKRQVMAKKYEPWLHFSVIFFFLATATIGAAIGLYNEMYLGPGCWIRDYPKGCYETGGCIGHYFGWVFTGLPSLLTLFAVIINNVVIYFHVKRALSISPNTNSESSTYQNRMSNRHKEQIQDVARQGLLYVGSFFLCYSCQFALRVLESSPFEADKNEGKVYWLLLIDSFLRPLQGFVNVLIYTRPNYVKLRGAFPEYSWFWAFKTAITTADIPKLLSTSERSTLPRNNTGPRSTGKRSGGSNKNGDNGDNAIGKTNRTSSGKSKKSGSYQSDLPVVSEVSNESTSSVDIDDLPFTDFLPNSRRVGMDGMVVKESLTISPPEQKQEQMVVVRPSSKGSDDSITLESTIN